MGEDATTLSVRLSCKRCCSRASAGALIKGCSFFGFSFTGMVISSFGVLPTIYHILRGNANVGWEANVLLLTAMGENFELVDDSIFSPAIKKGWGSKN